MPNIKQLSAHALVVRRFVDVPSTFQALTQQASKSVISALPATRRIIVEAGTPELDPTSPSFKPDELVGFARDLGETLLSGSFLPASKPNVKLLFGSTADATMAGASILTTSLPVSVLGYETAVGPRDGAFLVITPTRAQSHSNTRACPPASSAMPQKRRSERPRQSDRNDALICTCRMLMTHICTTTTTTHANATCYMHEYERPA